MPMIFDTNQRVIWLIFFGVCNPLAYAHFLLYITLYGTVCTF